MPNRRRLEQINELLREEIGGILVRENSDPLCSAITVTEVRVTPDLSHARVFVMVRKSKDGTDVATPANLERAREIVQRQLAGRVRIRKTPRLHFEVDQTAEEAERIEELLNRVKEDWEEPC